MSETPPPPMSGLKQAILALLGLTLVAGTLAYGVLRLYTQS